MHRPFGSTGLVLMLAVATSAVAQPSSQPTASRLQITPAPEESRPAKRGRATFFSMEVPVANRPLARGRTMLFGGWQPNERTTIGIGLFSIPRSATADPNQARIDPMKDPSGKTRRVAAVGMSFRF